MVSGNTLSAGNAYSSAMFYIVTYVLTTLGTFGMILLLSRAGLRERGDRRPRAASTQRSPWFAGVMTVFMFSLAGVPPTGRLLRQAGGAAGAGLDQRPAYIWLAVFAVLLSLIGAFYYLRIVKLMYFDEPIDGHARS